MTTDPGNFTGWHRSHATARWFPICHGPSPQAVLGKLLDATTRGDRAVLPIGRDPNDKPPTISSRRF